MRWRPLPRMPRPRRILRLRFGLGILAVEPTRPPACCGWSHTTRPVSTSRWRTTRRTGSARSPAARPPATPMMGMPVLSRVEGATWLRRLTATTTSPCSSLRLRSGQAWDRTTRCATRRSGNIAMPRGPWVRPDCSGPRSEIDRRTQRYYSCDVMTHSRRNRSVDSNANSSHGISSGANQPTSLMSS